jgi:hypothetical protein
MTDDRNKPSDLQRPHFMVTLGLLPPYSADDVRMAYREKAKAAHPDRGGFASDFQRLHEAYEQALEYVKFRSSRRQWLANQVERYTVQEAVTAEVRRRGGQVEVEKIDWIKHSVGEDFAALTDRLRGIRVRDQADGDAFLAFLAGHPLALEFLVWLDLAGCRISDEALQQIRLAENLKRLNLARTPVSKRGLAVLQALPQLEMINLGGAPVGWLSRCWLRWAYPRLRVAANATG